MKEFVEFLFSVSKDRVAMPWAKVDKIKVKEVREGIFRNRMAGRVSTDRHPVGSPFGSCPEAVSDKESAAICSRKKNIFLEILFRATISLMSW